MTGSASGKTTDLDREFAANTSLHGVARFFDSTRLPVRLLWLSILLGCLGVCVWQITDRFQRYLLHEATTAVSVEYVGDLDFPAVTICNFNRYRKSALTEADVAKLRAYQRYIDYDYDFYDYDSSVGGTPPPDDISDFRFTNFTLRTGFQMDEDTLLGCLWQSNRNSCTAKDGEKDVPILKQTQPGSNNGLVMTIDILQREYTQHLQSGYVEAGLKILVHDQKTPPPIDSEGSAIAPGVHAFVGVRKIEYSNLEPPWGKCDKSRRLTYYDKYTLSGCVIECRARKIDEECKCRLFSHPGNAVECTPTQVKDCAIPVIVKLRSGERAGCGCPLPCNYSEFRTSLSMATLPSNNLRDEIWEELRQEGINDTLPETYIRDNWILLDVYYETLNYEKYVQSEAITPSALISDIGGQLGLFLGASFITVTEVLHYLGCKAGRWMTTTCIKVDGKPTHESAKEVVMEEGQQTSGSKDSTLT
ncbi:acid-sensing ion channel 5-like isoform X2 [Acanthaster planci]|uniref:Acid-sensing ion channel 5-like isoform X2 n=1 Tax=Acanthaster planci TaxID=133434 RepID=A0A8B7Y2P8_ACAPL|nr:acid-sensing ion channel 5-like isoform X2 [Acanthaster planci]